MLLLFLDLFIMIFTGLGTHSMIGNFIGNPNGISLIATAGLGAIFVTLFVGISAIGVTQGSNFAGIPGILTGFLGRSAGNTAVLGVIFAVIGDYVFVYNNIISGLSNTFGGFWIRLAAMLIFFPLIIDALFASIDWARGVQT